MSDNIQQLRDYSTRLIRMGESVSLLFWDQQTYMPTGAANVRAEQIAVMSEFIHKQRTSDEAHKLLLNAEADAKSFDPDSDDARLVAQTRRHYDLMTKLPSEFVAELSRQQALGHEVWVQARKENSFAKFAPTLERIFDLTRQKAEYYGYKDHIYTALLDEYETGTTYTDVVNVFSEMKPYAVALAHAIAASTNPVDSSPIIGEFDIPTQRALTLKVVKQLGFDFNRGRQDEAAHPFCSNASRDDVRLTTRFDRTYLQQALYASLHEAGHGMYEQGSPERLEGTILAGGASLGVHESQSRLWENLVGRSRSFSKWVFPIVKDHFPQLKNTDAEGFYRAVNKVEPSFIRVEADEVTYNLHILLRFEMECELLTGKLAFKDVPEAWNAKMTEYLGITPSTDSEGCLQDVHWSEGLIGYFPTYTLGNLISAQLFHALRREHPNIEADFETGDFAPVLGWLRENVHGHGAKFLPHEVVLKATGEPLNSKYYVDYLNTKFGDIYAL
ncbi:carboxypeptidase M32 [Armatimonadota bacterium]|nr:carboxypeptidase M32 [Armatimonadota bacterium]